MTYLFLVIQKLLWMRQNEGDLFGKIKHILLPKDFLRLWLTGNLGTDHSDAAGTQLYDQRLRKWSNIVVDAVGLNSNALPPICESSASSSLRWQGKRGQGQNNRGARIISSPAFSHKLTHERPQKTGNLLGNVE